ncbi:MAG TPA: PAS domain-containing protein [Rhizomicrobium sp.]|nr:PAS domain-containing protein [Rhizomicrobium sp.]
MAERTLFFGNPEHPSRVVLDPDDCEQPALAALLAYWRSKRTADAAPQYSDFSPRDMAKHLGSIVVADANADWTEFRYRVVGSYVNRYLLSEATGKTVREEFPGELGEFLTSLNQQVCRDTIPIRLTGPAVIVDDILFPDYDTLYLPWATGDVVDKVVSIFVFDSNSLAARSVQTASLPTSIHALKLSSTDELFAQPQGTHDLRTSSSGATSDKVGGKR